MQNITGLTLQEFQDKLKFDEKGLLPAVAQSVETGEVLMLAYMNLESLQKTIDSKLACYWSRSRQSLWTKGQSSGHLQHVEQILLDCDGDTILLKVRQVGPACHTGSANCFFRELII